MTAQVVSLPAPTSPSPAAIGDAIAADGWFPSVLLSEIREAMRIGTVVTDVRLRDATISAIMSVRRQLAEWKAEVRAAGAQSLADVPADEINGESELVQLYRRAVFSFAAADLAETHRAISATSENADRADDVELSADGHRRNADWALADMVGRPRATIELI